MTILDIVESADMPVTSQTIAAANDVDKRLTAALAAVNGNGTGTRQ